QVPNKAPVVNCEQLRWREFCCYSGAEQIRFSICGRIHGLSPRTGRLYHARKYKGQIKLSTGVRARIGLSWLNKNLPSQLKRPKRTSKPLRLSRRLVVRLRKLRRKKRRKARRLISMASANKSPTSLKCLGSLIHRLSGGWLARLSLPW